MKKEKTMNAGIAILVFGLVLAGIGMLIKKFSKEFLLAGFNWKENVFWFYRPSRGNPFYEANANCIEKFGCQIQKTTESRYNSATKRTELQNVTKCFMTVKKTSADFWGLIMYLELATEKETDLVMNAFNALLDKQGN